MLSRCALPLNSKDTKLGSSHYKASPENTGIVLVPFRALKCVLTAISGGVDIFDVPGCHLLRHMSPK